MLNNIARRPVQYIKKGAAKENKNAFENVLWTLLLFYRKLRNSFASSNNRTVSKAFLRCRSIERTLTGNRLTFVTLDDLVTCTNNWVRSFPETYDLVVGIPRSGLLVANIIALKLGKPLTTPDRLNEDCVWMTKRSQRKNVEHKKILLVDDTVFKGRELSRALAILQQRTEFQITKAALFANSDEAANLVDLYYKILPEPALYEWNLMHQHKGVLATDMDGVICHDPPKGLDTDERAYLEWMRNARPYLIPLYEINTIVSGRLERYRAETENWLMKHRVRYKELILWNLPSMHDRQGNYAKHKSEVLMRVKPDLYWESNINEARQISESTRIPTLCVDRMIMFS